MPLMPDNSMIVQVKPHYAFVVRLLASLINEGELPMIAQVDVEPVYGHVARIVYQDGYVRMIRGGRTGINPHGSALIARDKGYSKTFLRRAGYTTPDWQTFVTDAYARRINHNLGYYGHQAQETIDQVPGFIHEQLGYPCYVKPNESSQGAGVTRCTSPQMVAQAIEEFSKQKIDVFIVEKAIENLSDYRVVVYRDAVVAAYLRRPLMITGDGAQPIGKLLWQAYEAMRRMGRKITLELDDPRIDTHIRESGYRPDDILPASVTLRLLDAANLSLGGTTEDVTALAHPHWLALCQDITRHMGLNLCGVDLLCADITNPQAEYAILEINAAPGMENFAAIGPEQAGRTRDLYRRIFSERLVVETGWRM